MHFVLSLAGKDKGKIFLVIKSDNDYVYIADGKRRKVDKPKRKNKKHVEFLTVPDFISIEEGRRLSDKYVRELIKEAKKCFCETEQ